MLKQSYSNKDLKDLTLKARTLWEIDLETKTIKKKMNTIDVKVPLQAIYRMVVEDWNSNKNNASAYHYPFISSSFSKIIGLDNGWSINIDDRKFIENDMYLFDEDGRTILIDINIKQFWETKWFNALSLTVGLVGLAIGIIG